MTLCQRCVSDLGRWGAWGRHARCCSPADAGAQLNHDHRLRPWTPGFAGNGDWGRGALTANATTPAQAGVQLGDGADGMRCSVTPAFPTGPRPSPGWGRVVQGANGSRSPRPPVGHGEAAPYGRAPSCRPRSRLVLRLIHQRILPDPRHHAAQLAADLLDRMRQRLLARRLQLGLPRTVVEDEVLHETA